MTTPSAGFPLVRAIRLVTIINVAWALLAAWTQNWSMVALQVSAAVVLFGVSFLVPKPSAQSHGAGKQPPHKSNPSPRQATRAGQSMGAGMVSAGASGVGSARPGSIQLGDSPEGIAAEIEATLALNDDQDDDGQDDQVSLSEWLDFHGSTVSTDELRRLIAAGADASGKDNRGDDLITLAVLAEAPLGVVEVLWNAGARVEDWPGLMERALPDITPEVLNFLLGKGLNPNEATESHESLVEEALEAQAPEALIQALIDGGAYTDVLTIYEKTLLGLALESGEYSLPLLVQLIPAPRDPSTRDSGDNQALLDKALAEVLEDTDNDEQRVALLAGWLVVAGADPMRRDEDGNDAPLTQAVEAGASVLTTRLAQALSRDQRLRMWGWVEALDEDAGLEFAKTLGLLEKVEAAWRQGYAHPAAPRPLKGGVEGDALAHKLQSVSHPEDRLALLVSGASPLLEVDGRTALDAAASRNQATKVVDYLEALSSTAADQWLAQASMSSQMRELVVGDLALRRHLRARFVSGLGFGEVKLEGEGAIESDI